MENKIKELENKIAIEKEKCEGYIEKGEEIKVKCVNLIVNCIKYKIRDGIETFVKKEVDNTNNLGLEKLSELKKEMNILIENTNNLRESISKENINIWKVSKDFISTIDFGIGDNFGKQYNNKKEISSNTTNLVKKEFSKIGKLLYEFNYLNSENKSKHGWELNGSTPKYSYGISLYNELDDTLKLYGEIFDDYFDSNERLIKYEKELKETKALLLWEQA